MLITMTGKIRMLALAGAVCIMQVQAAWNLPYPQPAKYNFAASFSVDFGTFLKADPDYLETSLAKGWAYYKSHFMMSNGLVNHMRGQNVGTNEAVSEGQGYGMLLALLNNDQATFNKIFGAANSILWDNGRKSYNWQYINGSISAGAAADADLDIGLALVFADEMVKKNYWTSYSTGGITYASRAMEIIRTIRTKMCSNDYLLPGDNWGGDAINNLNPSYFATAWLKVFNAYQSEVNFDAVITKCYQVLKSRTTQYSKGQAPDWCTSTGGRASQRQSLGMTSDGIRTPWRIAMDALWFNDSRAKEFCVNSSNTLTRYIESNKNLLLAQMCQYEESGAAIASTCGSCSEVAMWLSAVVGSRDQVYVPAAATPVTVGRIVGQYDCFGDKSLSDHLYYYKQSLAILGFAALSGQFPNILDDLRNPVMAAGQRQDGSGIGEGPLVRSTDRGVELFVPREMDVTVEVLTPAGRVVVSQNGRGRMWIDAAALRRNGPASVMVVRLSEVNNANRFAQILTLR